MNIRLISIGTKMPTWVTSGFNEYAKRLPRDYALELIELPAVKRGKEANLNKILEEEGQRLLAASKPQDLIIALDRQGETLDTATLSKHLLEWHDHSQSISLLIGGPEGISSQVLQQAHQRWSLSALTLPHPLVRVVIAEQCYRAWSILTNHPYHR